VYFAGPLAGFVLCGLVVVPYFLGDREDYSPWVRAALAYMVWINLFWGALNLVPIWPLDGGQISRDVLDWLSPRRGIQASLCISFTIAALLAINALAVEFGVTLIPLLDFLGGAYIALFFGLLALGSYQALQMESGRRRPWQEDADERVPWERDADYWRR
jgi:Zn-dependent protease